MEGLLTWKVFWKLFYVEEIFQMTSYIERRSLYKKPLRGPTIYEIKKWIIFPYSLKRILYNRRLLERPLFLQRIFWRIFCEKFNILNTAFWRCSLNGGLLRPFKSFKILPLWKAFCESISLHTFFTWQVFKIKRPR